MYPVRNVPTTSAVVSICGRPDVKCETLTTVTLDHSLARTFIDISLVDGDYDFRKRKPTDPTQVGFRDPLRRRIPVIGVTDVYTRGRLRQDKLESYCLIRDVLVVVGIENGFFAGAQTIPTAPFQCGVMNRALLVRGIPQFGHQHTVFTRL